MNRYILMWLEAPLQSWGYDSKFNRRDTLNFPTKSGLLGMICCGRGASGEQREWLESWQNTDMQLAAYVRQASSQKASHLPMLRDFHMVGSGYDDSDPWQRLHIPKTAEGKKAVGTGSKLTYRNYLQDIAFAVALEVPSFLHGETVQALTRPVWDLYIGRKSCTPTEFIMQGEYDTAHEALVYGTKLAEEKGLVRSFRVVQGENFEGTVFTLNDVPRVFGASKEYRDRRVTLFRDI